MLVSVEEELQSDSDAQMTVEVEEYEKEEKIETCDDPIEEETVVKQIHREEDTKEEERTDYEYDDNESSGRDFSARDGLKVCGSGSVCLHLIAFLSLSSSPKDRS